MSGTYEQMCQEERAAWRTADTKLAALSNALGDDWSMDRCDGDEPILGTAIPQNDDLNDDLCVHVFYRDGEYTITGQTDYDEDDWVIQRELPDSVRERATRGCVYVTASADDAVTVARIMRDEMVG